MIGKLLATDVESIDHEVASTEWEKTRRSRQCGVGAVEEDYETLLACDHEIGDLREQSLIYVQVFFVNTFLAALGIGSRNLDLCARWHENSSWRIEFLPSEAQCDDRDRRTQRANRAAQTLSPLRYESGKPITWHTTK